MKLISNIQKKLNGLLLCNILLLTISFHIQSQPLELSGEQDGLYEKHIYIVTKDVIVKEKDTLTFSPGSIIKFNRFTGIRVNGTLQCKGNLENPIIFTSVNDTNLQAFSWNGIYINNTGSIILRNCTVEYSTFGIECENSSKIDLSDIIFKNNGRSNFSKGDNLFKISPEQEFSYNNLFNEPSLTKDTLSKKHSTSKNIKPLRSISAVFTGITICATGIFFAIHKYNYNQCLLETENKSLAEQYESRSNTSLTLTSISGISASVGAVVLGSSIIATAINNRNGN